MTYRCLGSHHYEITLTVYRDCSAAAEDVPFDPVASIGVFEARNGNLLYDLRIPFMEDDTIFSVLPFPCFNTLSDVCYHRSSYIDTVQLLPRPGGYNIAYQRCCRNRIIQNVQQPLRTGATFNIVITESALWACNNSPTFKKDPAIYLCVGNLIEYDHSVIDAEGDSVVYRLFTPLAGASFGNAMPQPPKPPPFDTLVWVPGPAGYSLWNMMGGQNDSLKIDMNTGIITVTPEIQGGFIVGISVEEYRDGELFTKMYRDFSYYVGSCEKEIVASIADQSLVCGQDTVQFQNFSENADDFIWYFDYPNDLSFTSTEFEPIVVFPDTGQYTIALIAEPDSICADTSFYDIYISPEVEAPDFEVNAYTCADSTIVEITNVSYDSTQNIVYWNWALSSKNFVLDISFEEFPSFTIPAMDTIGLFLVIRTAQGCTQHMSKIVPIENSLTVEPSIELFGPDTTLCIGETAVFEAVVENSGDNPGFQWMVNGEVSNNHLPTFAISTLNDGDVVQCELFSSEECAWPNPVISEEFVVSVDSCSSKTFNLLSTSFFSVYPNSSNSLLNVKSKFFSGTVLVRVYDYQGVELIREQTTFQIDDTFELELGNIPVGLKIITLLYDNQLITKKFIVKE